mgnify:CR=1 FL=1
MLFTRNLVCILAVLVTLAPFQAYADVSAAQAGSLVIRGGWLFDGISETRRPNTGIIIRDGKITGVDVDATQQVSTGAMVIDLASSETILPGFFDLHAHYNLDLVDQGRVEEAMDWIEDQTPGVRFVYKDGNDDYLKFVDGSGCSSFVGLQGGAQDVVLNSACGVGNAAHEMLHALGMYHEHTR